MINAFTQAGSKEVVGTMRVFADIWLRRYWIILVTSISTALFAAFAFLSQPIYRSTVVLTSASTSSGSLSGSIGSALGQLGGLASLVGVSANSGDKVTAEPLAILRSRRFTEEFIEQYNLLPVLFSSRWDNEKLKWKNDVEIPTLADGYKVFDRKIRSVLQDKSSGLITLSIDWSDRSFAADWANKLLEKLNLEMRQRAIEKSDRSLKYLAGELSKQSVIQVRESVSRLIEDEIKQKMLADVTEEYALRVIDSAMVSDAKDFIRPRRALMLAIGLLLGLTAGLTWSLMLTIRNID